MKKTGIWLLFIMLSLTSAKADELVPGYITHILPESKQARQKRHEIIAKRRAGIPLMVHRGATKEAPENTLEAYAAAMDLGADGVEIDIRRSRDGVLYLFHDETLDRETNGSGKVRDVTYYELLKLTPKHIYGRANKNTRPPTLTAFLVLARQRAMLLHLDIKEAGIQNELANMLDEMDMWDHIVSINAYNADRLRPPSDPNNRDPNAPYNKVRQIRYKGWTPTFDGDDEEIIKAILKWLPTKPGKQMVFCRDPRLAAKAMGKNPHKPIPIPENLRAWWGSNGIVKK
ncbi:MAG: hypothetical protein GWN67_29250 [Phycisphaerae bacterium]|nr:glycerophosphodiester phosphodiesterase family protein [Phycisphaerae bacterium]NIR62678.1 glycerophosphodiester phosphodiesterase family protein [candidate division Zixibacteria bacterium]NIP51992.1 glycerophosphodiester phosphodiesterase family protein [Phycisphaerae bacterium]NIS54817.1 glycerophosphodiester phosphodiesterase family protein [Phycisphaerae bacterium]NIU10752.1 glycerophosphodiester phosphodiesterase family protein [Phycisphaerae bacterium]